LSGTITEPQQPVTSTAVTPISATLSWPTSRGGEKLFFVHCTIASSGELYSTSKLTGSGTLTILGLTPETAYAFTVYKILKRSTMAKTPMASITLTTPSDIITNFVKENYAVGDGTYDLVGQKLSGLQSEVTSLFDTGDTVELKTRVKTSTSAKFVRNSASYSVPKLESIMLPFAASGGAGQDVTLQETTNNLDMNVSFDASANTISTDGGVTSVGSGNRFRIGFYRVSVCQV
jgi:hypothetical protein